MRHRAIGAAGEIAGRGRSIANQPGTIEQDLPASCATYARIAPARTDTIVRLMIRSLLQQRNLCASGVLTVQLALFSS